MGLGTHSLKLLWDSSPQSGTVCGLDCAQPRMHALMPNAMASSSTLESRYTAQMAQLADFMHFPAYGAAPVAARA